MIANISLGVSVVFYNSYLPRWWTILNACEPRATAEMDRFAAGRGASRARGDQQRVQFQGSDVRVRGRDDVFDIHSHRGGGSRGVGSDVLGRWRPARPSPGFGGWVFLWALKDLTDRPGPPVPPGTNLYTEGWIRTYRLLAHLVKTTPNTAWFLVLFFFFSDGYATIATVSVLFASRELCMGTVELSLLAVLVPLFAAIGGIAWFKFQQHTGWSSKSVLVLNLCLLAVLPLWGMWDS